MKKVFQGTDIYRKSFNKHKYLFFSGACLGLRRTSSHRVHGHRGRNNGPNSNDRSGEPEDNNFVRKSKHHLGPTGLFLHM